MIVAQHPKQSIFFHKTAVATNADSTARVDTLGFDYLTLNLIIDSAAAVSSNPSTMDIQESDDTVVTNFATITGGNGDTDFTIPAALTSLQQLYHFGIDLRGRKRYIRINGRTSGAAQLWSGIASLYRGDETPISAADMGAALRVNM